MARLRGETPRPTSYSCRRVCRSRPIPARCAVFVAKPSRAKKVVAAFLGYFRPDFWVSARYNGQLGWARKDNQVGLAHLIRDVQYVIDTGDAVFAPCPAPFARPRLPARATARQARRRHAESLCRAARCRPRRTHASPARPRRRRHAPQPTADDYRPPAAHLAPRDRSQRSHFDRNPCDRRLFGRTIPATFLRWTRRRLLGPRERHTISGRSNQRQRTLADDRGRGDRARWRDDRHGSRGADRGRGFREKHVIPRTCLVQFAARL